MVSDSRSRFEAYINARYEEAKAKAMAEGLAMIPHWAPNAAEAFEAGLAEGQRETARRCAATIQKYLDHHNAACAHYTPKDHPAFSYHLTRVAIAADIKDAIKAEFPGAWE